MWKNADKVVVEKFNKPRLRINITRGDKVKLELAGEESRKTKMSPKTVLRRRESSSSQDVRDRRHYEV